MAEFNSKALKAIELETIQLAAKLDSDHVNLSEIIEELQRRHGQLQKLLNKTIPQSEQQVVGEMLENILAIDQQLKTKIIKQQDVIGEQLKKLRHNKNASQAYQSVQSGQ